MRNVAAVSLILSVAFGIARIAMAATAIYSMDADGGNQTKVLEDPNLSFGSISVSPDGEMLAMDSWPSTGFDPTKMSIHVCKSDGTNMRQLTKGAMPKWSPDGSLLAYQDYYGTTGSAVIKANGQGKEPIAGKAGNPVWIGNDSLVLLEWGRRNFRLFDLASGEQKPLGAQPLGDIQHGYAISRDGSQICFMNGTGSNAQLVIVPVDDSKGPKVIHRGAIISSVDWHPDGMQIVFAKGTESSTMGGAPAKLYIANLKSGTVSLIPNQQEKHVYQAPCFSPDGRMIYFQYKSKW